MNLNDSRAKLSIVVPVANMSGQLHNLQSWLHKNVKNADLDIVIVHDIQDELTSSELGEIVSKSPNIRMIEGYFGSPGAARNAGIGMVNSPWICFWDADDLPIVDEVLASLLLHGKNKEVIIGKFEIYDFASNAPVRVGRASESFLSTSSISESPGLWRFLFRTEIIKDFEFPALRMGEDQVFLCRVGPFSYKYELVDTFFYHYFINRPGQVTKSKPALIDLFVAQKEILLTLETPLSSPSDIFRLNLLGKMMLTGIYRKDINLATKTLLLIPRILWRIRAEGTLELIQIFKNEYGKIKKHKSDKRESD